VLHGFHSHRQRDLRALPFVDVVCALNPGGSARAQRPRLIDLQDRQQAFERYLQTAGLVLSASWLRQAPGAIQIAYFGAMSPSRHGHGYSQPVITLQLRGPSWALHG